MVALHYVSLDDALSVQMAYQLVDEMPASSMATIKYIAAIDNFAQEAQYHLEEEADQPLPPGGGWAPNRGTLLDGWLNEAKNENAPKDSFWRKLFIFADKSIIADVIFGLIRQGRTKSNSKKTVDEELNSWPEVWLRVLVKTVKKRTKVPVRISLGIAALDQDEKKQKARKKKRKRGENESLPAGAEPEGENVGLPATECLGTELLQYGQPSSTSTQSSNPIRKLRIMVETYDHPQAQPQPKPQLQLQLQPLLSPQQIANWKKWSGYEIFAVTAVELNEALVKHIGGTRPCYAKKVGPSSESPVRVDPIGKRTGLFSIFLGQTGKNLAKRAVPAATSKDHEFSLPFSHPSDHTLELVESGDEFDMVYYQGIAMVWLPPDYFLVLMGQTFTDIRDSIKEARKPEASSLVETTLELGSQ